MTISEQCKIARLMTNSTATDQLIVKQVQGTNALEKKEACVIIDTLLIRHNTTFDKAFPQIVEDFSSIASKYKIDPASLFWIYMEWKKEHK